MYNANSNKKPFEKNAEPKKNIRDIILLLSSSSCGDGKKINWNDNGLRQILIIICYDNKLFSCFATICDNSMMITIEK